MPDPFDDFYGAFQDREKAMAVGRDRAAADDKEAESLPEVVALRKTMAHRDALVGKFDWADSERPVQERVEDFIQTQALAESRRGGDADYAGKDWERIGGMAQRYFPEIDPENLRRPFLDARQQHIYENQIQKAKEYYKGREGEADFKGKAGFIAERAVPVASAVYQFRKGMEYKYARDRVAAGEARPEDITLIAKYEQQQEEEAGYGLGKQIAAGVLHVPAIVGEAALGGAALRSLGIAPAINLGSKVAPQVAKAAVPWTLKATAKAVPAYLGRTTFQTLLMPTMYLPETAQRAVQHGGDWHSINNFGPAFAMGMMQVGILGAVSQAGQSATAAGIVPALARSGVSGYLSRLFASVGTGMTGQQGVDIANSIIGWRTGYGLMGDLMTGKGDDALKHAAVQAATFAAFGLLHAHQNPVGAARARAEFAQSKQFQLKSLEAFQYYLAEVHRLGRSKDSAGREALEVHKRLVDQVRGQEFDNQGLSKPAQKYADALESSLDVEALAAEQAKAPPEPAAVDHAAKIITEQGIEPREYFERVKPDAKTQDAILRRVGELAKTPRIAQDATSQAKPTQRPPEPAKAAPEQPGDRLNPQERADFNEMAKEFGYGKNKPIAPKERAMLEDAIIAQRKPTEPARPELPESIHHIVDYKNPANSADAALQILARKGTAPRPLETWDGHGASERFGANFNSPGHVAFEFARGEFSGQVETGAKQGRVTSSDPLRFNPGLQKILFKGNEADPKFARLRSMVEEINNERADAKLMAEYGHKGALKPISLEATERVSPPARPESPESPRLTPEQEATDFKEAHPELFKQSRLLEAENAVPFEIQQVLDQAKLNSREKYILESRARGNSHEAIAQDPAFLDLLVKAGGKRSLTGSRVQQIEAKALEKMGSEYASMVDWLEAEAEATGAVKGKRIRFVDPEKMQLAPETRAKLFNEVADADEAEFWQRQLQKEDREFNARYDDKLDSITDPKEAAEEARAAKAELDELYSRYGITEAPEPNLRGETEAIQSEPTPEATPRTAAPEADRSPEAAKSAEIDQAAFDAAFEKVRDKRYGFARIQNLRAEFPNVPRAEFDAFINGLRKSRHYTAEALEGAEGRIDVESKEAAIVEGGKRLGIIDRLPTWKPEAAKPEVEPEAADFGRPLTGAERAELVGGGQEGEGEVGAKARETALANARVDSERAKNGLPPLMSVARKANPEVWDQAMARLETDPRLADRLVGELAKKPRATTVEENALLLHRKIALQNEHERVMLEFVKGFKEKAPPDRMAVLEARERELFGQIDQLDRVTRITGTEWGRAGQFRRQLAREDFRLSSMLIQMQMAKGRPLTAEESVQITELSQKIDDLQSKLDAFEEAPTKPQIGQDIRIDLKNAKQQFTKGLESSRNANQTIPQRIFRGLGETLNLSRTIITSFDLSAVLRQGGFTTFAHPILSAKAIPEMLRSFASKRAADRAMDNINQRPNSLWYRRSGLFLAEVDGKLSGQEEAYLGRWAKKIPGIAGSERAYTTFLNRIRADVFDSMAGTLGAKGSVTDAQAKVIANFVNVATGRGGLGKFDSAAVPLATVFFSPRYVMSRFQLLAGQPMWRGDMTTRLAIAKEYARAAIGLGLFYGIAKLALQDEAKITFDARSTDFGKVRVGKTQIDPLTGLSQALVLLTRLGTGEKKTLGGQVVPIRGPKVKHGGDTAWDVAGRFGRGKLAPVPGALANIVSGENAAGEPVTTRGVARDLAAPMSVRDVHEAMLDQGVPRGTAIGLLNILGMGSQTYESKKK